MQEIELKAALTNMEMVLARLAELGIALSDPLRQEDVVYAERTGSLDEFLSNSTFLRIRTSPDGILFTVKHHPGRTGIDDIAALEHEVSVDSREAMERIIETLGYREVVRVTKERRKAKHGAYEICLDEVEGLGTFIEVEKLAEPEADVEAVRAELLDLLASLGVPREDIGARRYDILTLERMLSTL